MPYTPSIVAQSGRRFILRVGTGTSPTSWVTVGGVRTNNLNMNNNPVDMTNMGSNGFREMLADSGVQSMSLSCDGVFETITLGSDLLWLAARNRTPIECQLASGHGDIFSGYFVISTYSRSGAFDGIETFSATLESTGRINYSG